MTSGSPLLDRYAIIRAETEALCQPLAAEDFGIQAMPDVSPPKWHLAHTTWFFEEFLLKPFKKDWEPFHPQYGYLFNSYYEQVGAFFPRAQRGLLSRPLVAEIINYRAHIDKQITGAGEWLSPEHISEFGKRLELGLHHEQQHQELLLTDIKYNFSINPLKPGYLAGPEQVAGTHVQPSALRWLEYAGGMTEVGHDGMGFCFDNELPRHTVYMQPYLLAHRLNTNEEYLCFIEDGGYERPELWLSDGWRMVRERSWKSPLYWHRNGNSWQHFTLQGLQPLQLQAPVCHISFYEADAYARWAGCRLPEEAEWETAVQELPVRGNLREGSRLQPSPIENNSSTALVQCYGDVWEWTRSAYTPYPGYRTAEGALGEYNGKFMCNQMVLRGGSCVTSTSHIRPSYRNFFNPVDRWQFSGIRLAKDV